MSIESTLEAIKGAITQGELSTSAGLNLQKWLTEPRYAAYSQQVVAQVGERQWRQLDDAFCAVIPFGTGGRRGKMGPIGTNVINARTIGESAQGLAEYVRDYVNQRGGELSCAVACDTRHRSREFAELTAEIMVAAGYRVYFLDGYRSTPALSFTVRQKACACGVMITASHNPPSDNGFKAYWATGGQILPPHDLAIIERVMAVDTLQRADFTQAKAEGKIVCCQEEIDRQFTSAVVGEAFPGPRDLKLIYSPLHGVGTTCVVPVLAADGFDQVEVYGPQSTPDGDFPNVPGHVSNPENAKIFDALTERAKEVGADLAIATDPDCDRIGLSAPLTTKPGAEWKTMTGNQIAALLTDFVLERSQTAGKLKANQYIVKTLVTTDMMRRIADGYGVKTLGNLHVGFKWIADAIDAAGPEGFLFGGEESHGYLIGTYARDKDGAAAAMLVAEAAALEKSRGKTLHQKLDDLYWQFGCHVESLVNIQMPGAEGMDRMRELMAQFRLTPPLALAGLKVVRVRDYLSQTGGPPGGEATPLDAPAADMIMLDLENESATVAVRPSGTEPKVKFYLFAYEPAEQLANLEDTKAQLTTRLAQIASDLKTYAGV
jgi:phosphoglucomutase/phosphomannomutase